MTLWSAQGIKNSGKPRPFSSPGRGRIVLLSSLVVVALCNCFLSVDYRLSWWLSKFYLPFCFDLYNTKVYWISQISSLCIRCMSLSVVLFQCAGIVFIILDMLIRGKPSGIKPHVIMYKRVCTATLPVWSLVCQCLAMTLNYPIDDLALHGFVWVIVRCSLWMTKQQLTEIYYCCIMLTCTCM